MPTTLIKARTAVIKLSGQFPSPSSYADLLAIVSDYLDNQVPLNVENRNLMQRIAVLEAALDIKNAAPPAPKPGVRKGIDCTAWIGTGRCTCPACAVAVHA